MGKKRITKKQVLRIFYTYPRPVPLKEIYKRFSPSRKEKGIIKEILSQLEEEGKVLPLAGGRAYGLIKKMELIEGVLQLNPEGFGFVIPQDRRRKDIYIARDNLKDAWHGDRVLVALLPSRRGKNPEGRIIKILKREIEELPVIVEREVGRDIFLGRAADVKIPFEFIVDLSSCPFEAREQDVILVLPGKFQQDHVLVAQPTKRLGSVEEVHVQEEIVKILHSIPRSFPPEVLKEAESLGVEVSHEDKRGREDLTHLDFVTIDGKLARDFDDAIFVEPLGKGFRLRVAIADVSHYVHPGSALDREARERGNSYYFPSSVEPMFPPSLSTGLCSLNPGVDRLVLVVEIEYGRVGEIRGVQFYPAVIRSKKRLTYEEVKRAILDQEKREIERLGEDIATMLFHARTLAQILYRERRHRGSLDFDIPEPEVLLEVKGNDKMAVRPRERSFAHQIIEEFMIAANEVVALFLTENQCPCLYRVHPWPDEDKLNNLFLLLETLGEVKELPEEISPRALQGLLKAVEGKRYEFLVNRLLLRSMMQAHYDIKNIGHFGLASDCYCHFTSPIRRYSDIVVHRILKDYLGIASYKIPKAKKMRTLAEHLSGRERVALAAEREILKRISILLLRDKIGETFEGIVSSVAEFGFWVEIDYAMAEGLVKLSSLADDYYIYDHTYQRVTGKRTGISFGIGTQVKVKVVRVDIDRQHIDLELV